MDVNERLHMEYTEKRDVAARRAIALLEAGNEAEGRRAVKEREKVDAKGEGARTTFLRADHEGLGHSVCYAV